MRLRVVINDDLLAEVMKGSPVKTTKAVVEDALRTLVRLAANGDIKPHDSKRQLPRPRTRPFSLKGQLGVRKLRGKVKWEDDKDEG